MAAEPSSRGKRILVVDDERGVREVAEDILSAVGGYEVQTAANGAEGLQKLLQEHPDGVLLDLMMPIMDGWAFLRACRGSDVPIVVMTASPPPSVLLTSLGARTVVTKPFDLDALLEAVETHIAPSEG